MVALHVSPHRFDVLSTYETTKENINKQCGHSLFINSVLQYTFQQITPNAMIERVLYAPLSARFYRSSCRCDCKPCFTHEGAGSPSHGLHQLARQKSFTFVSCSPADMNARSLQCDVTERNELEFHRLVAMPPSPRCRCLSVPVLHVSKCFFARWLLYFLPCSTNSGGGGDFWSRKKRKPTILMR